jgi:hypothetical protein
MPSTVSFFQGSFLVGHRNKYPVSGIKRPFSGTAKENLPIVSGIFPSDALEYFLESNQTSSCQRVLPFSSALFYKMLLSKFIVVTYWLLRFRRANPAVAFLLVAIFSHQFLFPWYIPVRSYWSNKCLIRSYNSKPSNKGGLTLWYNS